MEFIVKGPQRTIRIESTLENFVELVAEVVRAAHEHGIALDEHSRANLTALGIAA